MIGLLPTYGQIGIAAPILLVALRIIQGIGLGGEWGGAVLMAYEYAPHGKRGYYASLPQMGVPIGLCLSSGVIAIMSTLKGADFLAWGWRVGFLFSFVLVVIGFYIRLKILETPDFAHIKEDAITSVIPFVDMIQKYRRNILLGIGTRFIDGVFFNVFAVFSIVYLSNTVKIPRTMALWGVSVSAFLMIAFIPIFGRLSDKSGKPRSTRSELGCLACRSIPHSGP